MSKREDYQLTKAVDGAPVFWKSLEEKNSPEVVAERAKAEFPRDQVGGDFAAGVGPTGRRGFLFGGISAALLAVEGCARRPVENILPYAKAPEYMLPGIPVHYSTVRAHRGDAIGLIVENHEGRPTKIAGNTQHPSSFGGTDAITQASILDLYDPDRSTTPRKGIAPAKWTDVEAAFKAKVASFAADGGAKLRILTEPTNSPTFMRLRDMVLAQLPHARFHTWAPVNESNAREGGRIAFGQAVTTIPDYKSARVILALDSDFLQTEAGMLRATKFFAAGRRLRSSHDSMSRLYVVEPSHTTTGANADHRLRLAAKQIEPYLLSLAKELSNRPGVDLSAVSSAFASPAAVDGVPAKWIKLVADELVNARGRGAVVAGSRQPARVHALVHAINAALGNAGTTVNYFPVADAAETDTVADLKSLTTDMDGGRVDTLLILGGNPVFDAPADLKFGEKLAKVPTSIHLSHSVDETSSKCSWHLSRAHELETWGDQVSLDGTRSVQQPMIAPLFDGRSDIEVLALLTGQAPKGHDLVRATFKAAGASALDLDRVWDAALQRGFFGGAAPRPFGTMPVKGPDVTAAFPKAAAPAAGGPSNLEINFAPDPKLHDGRHANNPWLLELPDLMTKITWDNAASISPTTAKALDLESGDVVTLSRSGVGSIETPVWILPGQADNTVSLNLGWGRSETGRYGKDVGVNAYPLRTSDSLGFADGGTMAKTGKHVQLVQTQEHQSMEGRPLAIDATLEEYRQKPEFALFKTPDPKTLPLWKPIEYKDHKWGMVIDLSSCTGCDACVIACQAENNIATVGKDQVFRNREMYWIRIDRYFFGENENEPGVALQPVACVQCEDAPCENVCPVNATAHSPEGLNDMAYNRCIGTRYCANNCPYKVRRFNYLEFQGGPVGSSVDTVYGMLPETRKMQFNPDVTVRMRGVMEKCTYCVQRIQEAKIASKRDDRPIRDGEIVTACMETCPADAIIFGDLNDPQSRVARISKIDRGYHLLSELGTHPRTTYLGKIRNPNPAMGEGLMAYYEPIKEIGETPLIAPEETIHSIGDRVFRVTEEPAPRGWWVAFLTAATFTGILFSCIGYLFWEGVGVWGNMAPVYWAWDITNFVWWIGIGHAGTLISAVLFLFRQKWRTSINRFAEAMTIFAVICALLFPGIHVGRPWFAYYMFPIPNQMTIWPNFKSPLVWDLFAVSTYFTVSLVFWYVGLIPDLASLRDRAKTRGRRMAYGFFALGWRGANRHWQHYERAYLILAALATPLVLSVHSVVSFDFATSVIPGWHTTIFPPYFVAGAVFSGFAMVMTLALITRAIYGMKSIITIKHLELMNKIILVTGSLVGYAYSMEFFIAYYSGNRYEFYHFFHGRAAGPFWWAWTLMMSCNVIVPQIFWFKKMRRSIPAMFVASLLINVGMWFERFVIIVTSLYRDFMPSAWAVYHPTLIDIFTYMGTLGLFFTLFLLFIRWIPMIAVAEVKGVLPAADPHYGHGHEHESEPHSEPGGAAVPVPGE